jgi:hypothetical protein
LLITGIGFGTLSYNGTLRLSVGIDESIIPRDEVSMDDFISNTLKELEALRQKQTV